MTPGQPRAERGLRQKAISGVKWTASAKIIAVGLQLLNLAVLGRILDPADFGLMSAVSVVINFAQAFVDMGLSSAIIARQNTTREQLSSLYWVSLLAGVALTALVAASAPLVASFYHEPRLIPLILLASLTFVFTAVGQQFQIIREKALDFKRFAALDLTAAFVGTIAGIATALLGAGVYALVWGQLGYVVARAVLFVADGWKDNRPMWRLKRDDLRGYVGFGIYQMADKSVNYFAWNMDRILILKLLGQTATGYYNFAYQLMFRPLTSINPIITRVAFPAFSQMEDDERLKRGYLKVLQLVSMTNFPIYMGMFATAHPLIVVLGGEKWKEAIGLFQVMVWLGILYTTGNPISSLLLAKGRPEVGFWYNLFSLFTYVGAVFIGVQWGAMGVALALLIAVALIHFPIEYWIRWYLVKMTPSEFHGAVLKYFLASAAMGLSGLGLERYLFTLGASNILRLIVVSIYCAAFYLGYMAVFNKSDMTELKSYLRRS